MSSRESSVPRAVRAYAVPAVPVLGVAVLLAFEDPSLGEASTLASLTRTAATLLLLAVAAAVAHAVLEVRRAMRHDSIRAEIAAGGGLGRRLMI